MEHGKPIFLHMKVLRAHRDVGRGSLKKRRLSCRSCDLHWKGGWLDFLLDQSRSARQIRRSNRAPGTSNENMWSFYNPIYMIGPTPFPYPSLMFTSGICPRTTCGGTEGMDSTSIPHPLRKKLLNHHKIKKYDALCLTIGHSSLLLQPVLVCVRVNHQIIRKDASRGIWEWFEPYEGKLLHTICLAGGGGGGTQQGSPTDLAWA
jgi:hypothetical protein